MNLMIYLKAKGVGMPGDGTKVECLVYKVNTGARVITYVPRIRPNQSTGILLSS